MRHKRKAQPLALLLATAVALSSWTTSPPVAQAFTALSIPRGRSPAGLFMSSPPAQVEQQQQQQQQVNEVGNEVDGSKSWTDDGFVFGLDGSGLERPTGRNPSVVVDGDSLETQPYQVAMVACTFAVHSVFLAMAFQGMVAAAGGAVAAAAVQAALMTVASWLLADFGSGVLHWSVDNYGNGKTPIMGSIIAAFQGHHSAPWTITQRGFCNNVHKLCIPFGPVPVAIISALTGFNPFATFFLTTFCIFEIMSQEFHKWSHQLKSESPAWVNWLQKVGLTVGRKPHAQHHLAPYDGNYCIISGACNGALDRSGFFRRLEHVVYNLNGVESNAWKLDPELRARTLAGDYGLKPATK